MNYPYPQQQPYPYPQQYPQPSPQQQRLHALEQQYPMYGQTIPPVPQPAQAQPVQQAQSAIMSVTSEQQARDYPLDLSGAVQLFVMRDDSAVFAKRFNVSNALPEFVVYERKTGQKTVTDAAGTNDNALLLSAVSTFDEKLNAIQAGIQAMREDVRNGNQSGRDSESDSVTKPGDASGNESGSGDGAVGTKSGRNNAGT